MIGEVVGIRSGEDAKIEYSRKIEFSASAVIELKSLILAQIERWRHALHMQVER